MKKEFILIAEIKVHDCLKMELENNGFHFLKWVQTRILSHPYSQVW